MTGVCSIGEGKQNPDLFITGVNEIQKRKLVEPVRFPQQSSYAVPFCCFFNFFFDNKKPTFTGKSVILSEIFKKAVKLPDSNFFEFERICS